MSIDGGPDLVQLLTAEGVLVAHPTGRTSRRRVEPLREPGAILPLEPGGACAPLRHWGLRHAPPPWMARRGGCAEPSTARRSAP